MKGTFDFTLDLGPREDVSPGVDVRPDAIDLFGHSGEPLEDQLGRMLVPQGVAVENLIIDRADSPSEN